MTPVDLLVELAAIAVLMVGGVGSLLELAAGATLAAEELRKLRASPRRIVTRDYAEYPS